MVIFLENGGFFKNIKKPVFRPAKNSARLQERTLANGCDFFRPKDPIFLGTVCSCTDNKMLSTGRAACKWEGMERWWGSWVLACGFTGIFRYWLGGWNFLWFWRGFLLFFMLDIVFRTADAI